jgi:hypothetical protein
VDHGSNLSLVIYWNFIYQWYSWIGGYKWWVIIVEPIFFLLSRNSSFKFEDEILQYLSQRNKDGLKFLQTKFSMSSPLKSLDRDQMTQPNYENLEVRISIIRFWYTIGIIEKIIYFYDVCAIVGLWFMIQKIKHNNFVNWTSKYKNASYVFIDYYIDQ